MGLEGSMPDHEDEPLSDVARQALGSAKHTKTTITAPNGPSRLVATGLVLVFLAVGFGLPAYLPTQAASWLTFVALVIAPGYLLGEIVTWRLDLDLLERLALAMPLGVFVMVLPGMVTMLGHMTIHDLATAWTLTVGCLIAAWLAFGLLVPKNQPRSRCPSWQWDEIVMLLLLVAAFVYMFPTLSLYKMDGDAYAVASFTADALTGQPLNATEPVLGTGRNLGSVRMGINQMLPIFHLWSYLSQIDHIELVGTASRSMLALWAILASYMLGKAAVDDEHGRRGRRVGFLTAAIQTLVFLAAPFIRSDHVGIFFFERINADKFTVTVTMLPVVLALAIRYARTGRRDVWIAAAMASFAVSSIHALTAAMLALALGAFGGLHLLLQPLRRDAWIRVGGLAVLTIIVMILPLVQLIEVRSGESLAPTYPSTFEGWSIEERLVPVFPFRQIKTLDIYGPLPNLAYLEAEEATTPTNPFLIWRFALNMRRQRIIVFDLTRYISDPTIILEPVYLLALLLLPILLWRLCSHVGAQFAVGTTLAVLFVMFNPVVTPILGSLVMPWILWRFVWLLPYALIIALATDYMLSAVIWLVTRPRWFRSAQCLLLAGAAVGLVLLAGLLLRRNILTNMEQIQGRGAAPLVYSTPDKIIARLRQETAHSGPVMVLADSNLSVTIPAFVGNADVVAHRILGTSELFPADQQDVALQRHIDQHSFLTASLLTATHFDILRRYDIRYIVLTGGTSLDTQVLLSPQWFERLVTDRGYSLYAVRELPTISGDAYPSIQGNADFIGRQWDRAQEHYQAALERNPADLLALLGLADIYRIEGQFDQTLATLGQALTQVEAQALSADEFAPVLHYRMGRVYADMGQGERSISELDLAQQGAPAIVQFHAALGDACLKAGQRECAQEQFEAAVNTLGMADEAQRLLTLADVWQQRDMTELALPLYEQAAAIKPDERTRLVLVDAYRRAERFAQAEDLLGALQQAYPLSVDVVSTRARLRAAEGRIDEAIALYHRALWLEDLLAQDSRITRMTLAQTLLDADRLDEARNEIDQVLGLQPHSATAYLLLGNLYRAQAEPDMAMQAYRYALRLDPTEAAAYTSLNDQHRQQATPPNEILSLMHKAVEFNPEQAILALALGDQLRRLGDVEMSITMYQQALGWFEPDSEFLSIGLQPTGRTQALAYSRLAALYEDLGQVDAAMNYYHAAVTAEQGQPWTWVTLGDALRRRNQVLAAEDAYRAAISIDPSQVDPYLRLASLSSNRRDTVAALEQHEQAVQVALAASNTVQTSRAWLALGSFYIQSLSALPLHSDLLLGSDEGPAVDVASADPVTQQALAAYYQGLEAEESVAGVRTLARLYQDLGQSEKAIQLFEERIQQGEQERWVPSLLAQYYVGLGDAYLDGHQAHQAITAYRHAVNLDGWWPGARLALARGLSGQGDQEGAMAETQRAVAVAPGSVETQLALAGILDQAGDGERALAIYQATAQAHRGSAPANLALARAWQDRYRWDMAEQSYRQALTMVPGETEAYLGLANLLVLQARYVGAESLLRQALEVDGSDIILHLRLGDTLALQARHTEALEAYQQAVQVNPADWQAYAGLAQVHRALGEIEQAEGYLRQAIAATTADEAAIPQPIVPFLQLANLYQEQNQPEQAEEILRQALERFPGEVATRQALAEFYQSMARADKALRELRLAVEENPNSMVVLVSYADQLRLRGLPEEAETVYHQAEETGEPSGAGYRALAASRQAQGRNKEALAWVEQAIVHDPANAGNWIQKAQIQMQVGESEGMVVSVDLLQASGARAALERATALGLAEGRTWFALGNTLLVAGSAQEAVAALEQAITVEPTYLPAYGALVEAYQELGQGEQMARIVTMAHTVAPGSYLVHLYAAQPLQDVEAWDEARAALKQALAKAPGVPEIYTTLGQLEQHLGNNEEAAAWYRQAIDLRPGDQTAYVNLIDLLLSQGDNFGALAVVQGALEKRPGDDDLRLRLGRVQRVLGRYAEAESTLQPASQQQPLLDPVHAASADWAAELGLLYLAQGSPEKAITAYERAITLRRDQPAYYLALSRIWSTQGRPEHALSLLKDALSQVSRPAPLLAAMSGLYLRRGETTTALQILEQGLQEYGDDVELLQALGAYYQSQANYDEAAQIYQRLTTLYPEEAAGHLATGREHLERGRVMEALVEFEQAANLDPLNANACLALGDAYQLIGQADEAIASYSRALVVAPRVEGAYMGLASVYRGQALTQGATQLALQSYERGLAVAPTSGRLLIDYSNLLLQRGDPDQALRALDRATQLSAIAGTYLARAALYRVLGRSADAQRDLETALQIEPGSVEALIALGDLYRVQGEVSDAKDAYRRALSLAPGIAAPYVALAELAYDQGQLDEAWWQFEAARKAEPASPDPIVSIAAAHASQGDWENAETAYRRVIEMAPATTEAYLGLADVLQRRTGNLEETTDWLQQISNPGVRRGALFRTIGEIYRNAGQSGRAEDYFQQAIQLEPSAAEAYLAMADLYLAEGRPREAERYALLALDLAPRDPAVRISLANVYHSLGDFATAERYFQEAIDLDATRLDGYTSIASFYVTRERYAEAIAAYEKAIGLAPLDWTLWLSLGNFYLDREKYADALSAFGRATEINITAPEPWLGQGDVQVAKKKWGAAQKAYEQAHTLRPNQPDALLRLASLYEQREDLRTAKRYADQAIELDPSTANGYVTLGRIQSARDKAQKAADAYLAAIQRDPRRRAAYDRWMWAYTDIKRQPYSLDRSRLKTALAEIAKAPESDDESGSVWAHVLLGLGYLTLDKDTDQIVGHLEKANRMDPAFAELYQELASLYEKSLDGPRALEMWYRYLYATARTSDTSETQKQIDTLLQIQIEQPGDGDLVSGSVQITGTATGKSFGSYKIAYSAAGGAAESSDTWSTIDQGKSKVKQGELVTWNTAGLSPGKYRIRLSVVNSDGKDRPYDEITVQVVPAD